jgi:hypothetical protein
MSESSSKKNSSLVIMIVIAVVFFGIGFGTAKLFPGSSATTNQGAAGARQGAAGRMGGAGFAGRGGAAGAGFVTGQVEKADATSLSVKLRDGSVKLVLVASSTKASHTTDATIGDITVGSDVVVNGTTNSDGSVTAQMIQIRPAGQNLPPVGQGQPQAPPQQP